MHCGRARRGFVPRGGCDSDPHEPLGRMEQVLEGFLEPIRQLEQLIERCQLGWRELGSVPMPDRNTVVRRVGRAADDGHRFTAPFSYTATLAVTDTGDWTT